MQSELFIVDSKALLDYSLNVYYELPFATTKVMVSR